jgi:hypothetical protein
MSLYIHQLNKIFSKTSMNNKYKYIIFTVNKVDNKDGYKFLSSK